MTWFTDSPFKKMMSQRPTGRRVTAPPVSYPPECKSCAYKGQVTCVGYCIKKIKEAKATRQKQEDNL